jgi:hypothetical protein
MKQVLPFVLALLLSPYAEAFDFNGCEITEIVLAGDQNAHVGLNCTISNIPACAVSSNYFGFDKTTLAGKQYLAMLMSAQAMGSKITGIVDHSICPVFQGNVALLNHLRVAKQ